MFLPAGSPRASVLVLHGSSGIRPVHRARVLADRGYAVLARSGLPADPSWPMGGTESADGELGIAVLDALDRQLSTS